VSSFEAGGVPRTIVVPGNGTQQASFTLPPGVVLGLESVVASVSAVGADARPELSISEQSGVVIATKRQSEAIPAGDNGTATWALRLGDEAAAAPGPPVSAAEKRPYIPTVIGVSAATPIRAPDATYTPVDWGAARTFSLAHGSNLSGGTNDTKTVPALPDNLIENPNRLVNGFLYSGSLWVGDTFSFDYSVAWPSGWQGFAVKRPGVYVIIGRVQLFVLSGGAILPLADPPAFPYQVGVGLLLTGFNFPAGSGFGGSIVGPAEVYRGGPADLHVGANVFDYASTVVWQVAKMDSLSYYVGLAWAHDYAEQAVGGIVTLNAYRMANFSALDLGPPSGTWSLAGAKPDDEFGIPLTSIPTWL